jgi:tight adherence protein B
MVLFIIALAFLAGILIVAGCYSFMSDMLIPDQTRAVQRVDDAFRMKQREKIRKSALFKAKGKPTEDENAIPTMGQRYAVMIEQADLTITLGQMVIISIMLSLLLGLLLGLLLQSILAGVVVACLVSTVPTVIVSRIRDARLHKMLSQLPDAFDLMARMVRAGQTVSQAVQAVAQEFPPPLAPEFLYCAEQQNLGLPPEVAMRDLARRTGLLEIKILVLALLVQQQSGGNLAEMFDSLAAMIRDRFRIRGQVRSLTAEGRVQANILLALPPLMLVAMMLLNRAYVEVLFTHVYLLVITGLLMVAGYVWIRRIARVDF